MIEGITGLCCDSCHWADQCGGDEICEYFDSLDESVNDELQGAAYDHEYDEYLAVWRKYCEGRW